jgi:hypothetical protein
VDAALLPVPEPNRAVRILRRTHAEALTRAWCGASPELTAGSLAFPTSSPVSLSRSRLTLPSQVFCLIDQWHILRSK